MKDIKDALKKKKADVRKWKKVCGARVCIQFPQPQLSHQLHQLHQLHPQVIEAKVKVVVQELRDEMDSSSSDDEGQDQGGERQEVEQESRTARRNKLLKNTNLALRKLLEAHLHSDLPEASAPVEMPTVRVVTRSLAPWLVCWPWFPF